MFVAEFLKKGEFALSTNPHEKHRKRSKELFLADGFSENTPEHKILEMLLFYSIPRIDTNEIAHNLINRFGSIAKVIDAPAKELVKVKGIGENSAALIKLMSPIINRYINEKKKTLRGVRSMDEIFDFVLNKYITFTDEVFAITSFNAAGEILDFDVINSGDLTSVGFSMRKIIEIVIERKATAVVISHNHPHGNAVPSNEDIASTMKIKEVLEGIGVKLLDHIIIAEGDGVSLRQSQKYYSLFK